MTQPHQLNFRLSRSRFDWIASPQRLSDRCRAHAQQIMRLCLRQPFGQAVVRLWYMLPKGSAKQLVPGGARRYGYRYFLVIFSYLQKICWESCHICHLVGYG